jgi:hypothetical protein
LFAYSKQANNTNMLRLFMFVCSTAAAVCRHLLYRVCADLAAGCTQGLWKHRKVCGPCASIPCNDLVLLLPCPGLSVYRYGCHSMCVIDASIGFVQHSLPYNRVCAT